MHADWLTHKMMHADWLIHDCSSAITVSVVVNHRAALRIASLIYNMYTEIMQMVISIDKMHKIRKGATCPMQLVVVVVVVNAYKNYSDGNAPLLNIFTKCTQNLYANDNF